MPPRPLLCSLLSSCYRPRPLDGACSPKEGTGSLHGGTAHDGGVPAAASCDGDIEVGLDLNVKGLEAPSDYTLDW